ncbi:MAG: archaemetzincin [Acidobacteria bacterium]|nr:archaemetzincin [Acidobacteriota bacterium]
MKPIRLVPVRDITVWPSTRNGSELTGLLEPLSRDLARTFAAPCHIGPESLDAGFALDEDRGQYHSSAILKRLVKGAGQREERVLGVTALDLYVPILTFVFGEALLEGNCAVVSLHRLREELYGLPPRTDLLFERLVKESVHELGHTFGLRHCFDWQCVMASSFAVERIDVKSAGFCAACRKVVAGRPVPIAAT